MPPLSPVYGRNFCLRFLRLCDAGPMPSAGARAGGVGLEGHDLSSRSSAVQEAVPFNGAVRATPATHVPSASQGEKAPLARTGSVETRSKIRQLAHARVLARHDLGVPYDGFLFVWPLVPHIVLYVLCCHVTPSIPRAHVSTISRQDYQRVRQVRQAHVCTYQLE